MRTALFGLMLAALLASGCIYQKPPFVWTDDNDPPVQPVKKHVPAVRADQVTAENAHQIGQQLEDELESDRDAPK